MYEDIKKGLKCCANIGDCKYETNKECPYRLGTTVCQRSKLMNDAICAIKELEKRVNEQYDKIYSAQVALCGPIDDGCCYDCEVKND